MTQCLRGYRLVVGATGVLGTTALAQNMIINASFEDNTAGGTIYNMSNDEFNATMADMTAFGDAEEIDIMDHEDEFGLPPVDGDYKIALHRNFEGLIDMFAFHLDTPILSGAEYDLAFWHQPVTTFTPLTAPIEIGVSESPTSFGTLVFTGPLPPADQWTKIQGGFASPVDGLYLTVRPFTEIQSWSHIDGFSLTLVPAPGSLALLGGAALLIGRRRRE